MMIYRSLGSTGEKVSAIGLGGWHLGLKNVDEQLAIRIVRPAIDRGINFLVTAGITTKAPARYAWERQSATAIARKHSSCLRTRICRFMGKARFVLGGRTRSYRDG